MSRTSVVFQQSKALLRATSIAFFPETLKSCNISTQSTFKSVSFFRAHHIRTLNKNHRTSFSGFLLQRKFPVNEFKSRSFTCVGSSSIGGEDYSIEEIMATEKTIGFLGAGQMCEALARGFIESGVCQANKMVATDISPERRAVLATLGISTTECNLEVGKSDVIFVAVKPNIVRSVLQEIKSVISPNTLIVSIAAGLTLSTLMEAAGGHTRVVRVMPNVATLVGQTAAAMCLASGCDEADEKLAGALFASVGVIHKVDEKLLDAVTGLSGSGPAYVFVMIEALADGGVRAGLPRDIAMSLAAQTVYGASKMVMETGKHPGALKDMVTSPGGTTIAGLHAMEDKGVRGALMDAVMASANRATEMSKL